MRPERQSRKRRMRRALKKAPQSDHRKVRKSIVRMCRREREAAEVT